MISFRKVVTVIRKNVIALHIYVIDFRKSVIDDHKVVTIFRKVVIAFRIYVIDSRKKEINHI